MALQAGIVGLPNVGKSTLFNALTAAGADAANYPFCTIEPNVGVVVVPDPRLEQLAAHVTTKEVVPTVVEIVDIAGLVRGASEGEGLGNQFLGHIRNVDALLHVVRCFEDPDVAHVDGTVDPLRDIATLRTELILADLQSAERRHDKWSKQAKGVDREATAMATLFGAVAERLADGNPACGGPWTDEQQAVLDAEGLLTTKPVLYVCNVDEAGLSDEPPAVGAVRDHAAAEGAGCVVLCGKLEAEIAELDPEDRAIFLEDVGLQEPGLNRLVRATYDLLGLQTFFTANENQVHAWPVRKGACAPEAAGVVHTDFERGFIRAEVYSVAALVEHGSEAALRGIGKLHVHGKDYVVQDGDVLKIRFNV